MPARFAAAGDPPAKLQYEIDGWLDSQQHWILASVLDVDSQRSSRDPIVRYLKF
jgi:hypothetical protein